MRSATGRQQCAVLGQVDCFVTARGSRGRSARLHPLSGGPKLTEWLYDNKGPHYVTVGLLGLWLWTLTLTLIVVT